MSDGIPRLRMFAGPNGSGKTTVKNSLNEPQSWFGLYINPDEIERAIQSTGFLAIAQFQLRITVEDIRDYFSSSRFLQSVGFESDLHTIHLNESGLDFRGVNFNSYHASVLSDYLRRNAMEMQRSFSFETVMSSGDKIDLLRDAKTRGYRIYLYFVATNDPDINVQRVKHRRDTGGHDVPPDKIVSRYYRSLKLLSDAIPLTDRAYFFDTSEESAWFFAEITNGDTIELQSNKIPAWFQPIWDGLPAEGSP